MLKAQAITLLRIHLMLSVSEIKSTLVAAQDKEKKNDANKAKRARARTLKQTFSGYNNNKDDVLGTK